MLKISHDPNLGWDMWLNPNSFLKKSVNIKAVLRYIGKMYVFVQMYFHVDSLTIFPFGDLPNLSS